MFYFIKFNEILKEYVYNIYIHILCILARHLLVYVMMHWNFVLLITCLRLTSCEIILQPTEGNFDWWQSSIIYEIFPLSFKDSNGDGSGDFQGIL